MGATVTLDADLITRVRSGDPDAFAALVGRHDEMLRSLAYRMLGDPSGMDDALQDAYLRAFRGIGSFKGASSIATWLYRIVYTSCIDQIRRRRSLEVLTDAPFYDAPIEVRLDPAGALQHLPPEHRAVVMLIDGQGFNYAEVAEITGVPTGTVKSRLSRAHRSMRAFLGGDEE